MSENASESEAPELDSESTAEPQRRRGAKARRSANEPQRSDNGSVFQVSVDAAAAASAVRSTLQPAPDRRATTGKEPVSSGHTGAGAETRGSQPRAVLPARSSVAAMAEGGREAEADRGGVDGEGGGERGRRRAAYAIGSAVLIGLVATLLATTGSSPSKGSPTQDTAGGVPSGPGAGGPTALSTLPWTLTTTQPSGNSPSKGASVSPGAGAGTHTPTGGAGPSPTAGAGKAGSGSGSEVRKGGSGSGSGGSAGGSPSTTPTTASTELFAGPGCSMSSSQEAFVDYGWYTGTDSNGTTGWSAQSSGGYSGCGGRFQSMPMSGSGKVTAHASWYFHFSTSITRCQFALYIPSGSSAQVGGNPADYGYYVGGSESAAGTFSIAQLSHEGSWVVESTVAVSGGELEIQEYNAGIDYDSSDWNAHDAVAQAAVDCD